MVSHSTRVDARCYRLTAVLDGRCEAVQIVDDADAVAEAIREIRDRAHADKSGPWALGAVTLRAPDGELVAEMAPR